MCATCETRPHARGLCGTCYRRAHRQGYLDKYPATLHRRGDVVEDCEVLAESGETAAGAAVRLGYGAVNSLYMELRRAGRLDLWQRLRAA